MKKYVKILSACIILQIVIGMFLFNYRDNFLIMPTEKNMKFSGLHYITHDSAENMYTVDDSRKRVTKIDKNFKIQFIIENKKSQSLPIISEIAVDDDEGLYIMNTVLDSNGYFVKSEEIEKYNKMGKFEKIIYRIEYPEDKRPVRTGNLKMLRLDEKNVYFYNIQDNKVILNSVDKESNKEKIVIDTQISKGSYIQDINIQDITGIENDKIFYSTKKGEIYKLDIFGNSDAIYNDSKEASKSKSLPYFLDYDGSSHVYFLDVTSKEIKRFTPGGVAPAEKVFSIDDLVKKEYGIENPNVEHLNVGRNLSIYMAMSDNIVKIGADREVEFVKNSVEYSRSIYLFRWLIWIALAFEIILFVMSFILLYFKIMKRRVSLLLKQVLIFVPIVVTSLVLVSSLIYRDFTENNEQQIERKLNLLVHVASNKINVDNFNNIRNPHDFMGEAYKKLRTELRSLLEGEPYIKMDNIYLATYKYENNQLYICSYYDDSVSPYYPKYPSEEEGYEKVAKNGKVATIKSEDSSGSWMYSLAPVYDKNRNIVGLVEAGFDMNGLNKHKNLMMVYVAKLIIATIIVIIAIFLFMVYYFLAPLRKLKRAVDEIASGNLNVEVYVDSRDETADLCNGFNIMSKYIRDYVKKITTLNEAYYRFVPKQYLSMLEKESIVDVKLGDQVKCEISVLNLNIRDFFILSKTMSPEENFYFINSFLKDVSPMIADNNGFVDKYLGAGIMALFPKSSKDSVETAIAIMRKIRRFNDKTSSNNMVDVGIGIHKGPLMLGIIGDEKRLEGTVISDTVNVSSALEQISLKFGAYVLITENIVEDIKGFDKYQYRLIGLVRLEGKEDPVVIYDLYQCDDEYVRKLKHETKETFEEGVKHYQSGNFYEARNKFLQIIRKNNKDKAAKIYFFLCDKHYENGVSEGWKGILE